MNNDDERDYDEERANRRELEPTALPTLAELKRPYVLPISAESAVAVGIDPGYLAAALGEGPQPDPARIHSDHLHVSFGEPDLPRFTPSLDGRGTEQVDTSGFESGWWLHLHEGEDYSIYYAAAGLMLTCLLCPPAEIPLGHAGSHRTDLGAVMRAIANHRRNARH